MVEKLKQKDNFEIHIHNQKQWNEFKKYAQKEKKDPKILLEEMQNEMIQQWLMKESEKWHFGSETVKYFHAVKAEQLSKQPEYTDIANKHQENLNNLNQQTSKGIVKTVENTRSSLFWNNLFANSYIQSSNIWNVPNIKTSTDTVVNLNNLSDLDGFDNIWNNQNIKYITDNYDFSDAFLDTNIEDIINSLLENPKINNNPETKDYLNHVKQQIKESYNLDYNEILANLEHIQQTVKNGEKLMEEINKLKEYYNRRTKKIIKDTKNILSNSESTVDSKVYAIREELNSVESLLNRAKHDFHHIVKKWQYFKKDLEQDIRNLKEAKNKLIQLKNNWYPIPDDYIKRLDNYINTWNKIYNMVDTNLNKDEERKFKWKVKDALALTGDIEDVTNFLVDLSQKLYIDYNSSLDEVSKIKSKKDLKEVLLAKSEDIKIKILAQKIVPAIQWKLDNKILKFITEVDTKAENINKEISKFTKNPDTITTFLKKTWYLKKWDTVKSALIKAQKDINEYIKKRDVLLQKWMMDYNLKVSWVVQYIAKKMWLKAEIVTDTSLKWWVLLNTKKWALVVDPITWETFFWKTKKEAIQNFNQSKNNHRLNSYLIDTQVNKKDNTTKIKIIWRIKTDEQKLTTKRTDPNNNIDSVTLDKNKNYWNWKKVDLKVNEYDSETNSNTKYNFNVLFSNDKSYFKAYAKEAIIKTITKDINNKDKVKINKIDNIWFAFWHKFWDKNNLFGELNTQASLNYFLFTQEENDKQIKDSMLTVWVDMLYTKNILGNKNSFIDFVWGANAKIRYNKNDKNLISKFDGEASLFAWVNWKLNIFKDWKNYLNLSWYYLKWKDIVIDPSKIENLSQPNIWKEQLKYYDITHFWLWLEWQYKSTKYRVKYSEIMQELMKRKKQKLTLGLMNDSWWLTAWMEQETINWENKNKYKYIKITKNISNAIKISVFYNKNNINWADFGGEINYKTPGWTNITARVSNNRLGASIGTKF